MSMYDRMYSTDAARYRELAIRGQSLGLSLTDTFECSIRKRTAIITIGYGGSILVKQRFPMNVMDYTVIEWFRKQINDYQSWSSIK